MRNLNQGNTDVALELYAGQDYLAVGGTFARASEASYIDEQRRLQYAAAGSLRDNHWVKGKRGWLLEGGSAVQLCTQPQTPASWSDFGAPVVTTGQTDPWGGSAAVLLEDADVATRRGKNINVTFTGNGTKAVVFCVRPGSATQLALALRDTTAGNIDRHAVYVTWPNGPTATPAVTTAGGTGKIAAPVDIVDADGNVWWLIGFTVDGVVAANSNLLYAVRNDTTPTSGTFYFAGANAWNAMSVYSWQRTTTRERDDFFLPHGMANGANYTIYTEGHAGASHTQTDNVYGITSWYGLTRVSPNWGFQLRLNAAAVSRRPQFALFAPTGFGTQAIANDTSAKNITYHDPYVRCAVQIQGATSPPQVAMSVRYDDEATLYQTGYSAGDTSGPLTWTAGLLRMGGAGTADMTSVFITRIRIVKGLVSATAAAFSALEAVGSRQIEMVHLLALDFSSGTVRLTTAAQDLDWGGYTWQAVGGLLEIGGVEETSDGKAQGTDLRLSGVDQSLVSTLLSNNYRGRDATIYRVYIQQATGLITGAVLLHKGLQLAPYTVQEDRTRKGGTVRISTRLAGYLSVRRVRGLQANLISHQHHYADDTFFQHAASLANTPVYWATAVPVPVNRGNNDPGPVRAPPAYGG